MLTTAPRQGSASNQETVTEEMERCPGLQGRGLKNRSIVTVSRLQEFSISWLSPWPSGHKRLRIPWPCLPSPSSLALKANRGRGRHGLATTWSSSPFSFSNGLKPFKKKKRREERRVMWAEEAYGLRPTMTSLFSWPTALSAFMAGRRPHLICR